MWFGILFAILVEIVPLKVRSTTIGIFLFVMNNIGGNLPIAVEPVSKAIGYRESLYIFYAGAYGLSKHILPKNISLNNKLTPFRFHNVPPYRLLHGRTQKGAAEHGKSDRPREFGLLQRRAAQFEETQGGWSSGTARKQSSLRGSMERREKERTGV